MKKILHIAFDDKFISNAQWIFEQAFPEQNTYYIILDNDHSQLQYININQDFIYYTKKDEDIKDIVNKLNHYDLVVLHWLDPITCKIILLNVKQKHFLWMFWGGELYNNREFYPHQIYGNITKKTFVKKNFTDYIRPIYKTIIRQLQYNNLYSTPIKKAIEKIQYLGIFINEEYTLFKDLNVFTDNMEIIQFTYYPLEKIIDCTNQDYVNGENILIGNSATQTNNHFEIIALLNKMEIRDRKVIAPLSYGDKVYAQTIIKNGKNSFGIQGFIPLIDFMPIYKYNEIIKSCSFVIMNHYRQQAFGNIIASLWYGAKVFLNKENNIYIFLKRNGFIVFSMTDLAQMPKLLNTRLSMKEMKKNRSLLREILSLEKIIKALREDIEKKIFET